MKRLLLAIMLLFSITANAVNFTDIKFGTKQMGDAQWNVSACTYTTTCTSSAQAVGSIRAGNGVNFTLGATQYMKFSYTNTDPAEPWTITVYNANGTVASVLGTYRIINAGQGYFMTSNAPHPNAGNGSLWSTQTGMVSGSKTFTEILQPTQTQMDSLANSYYSPDPIYTAGAVYTPPNNLYGGSSTSFSASTTNVNKVTSFVTRTTSDSQVYIEQIGNSNTVEITQEGTKQNYVKYFSSGSYNNVTVTQLGNSSTQSNYVDVAINGSSNIVDITQNSTGGGKGVFASINDNNNNVTVLQKDGGSDYLNLSLSGGSKTVNITQQGAGNHMADITLSGAGSRSLNLTQQGSTQQSYSLNSSCASNCQAITVTQGQ